MKLSAIQMKVYSGDISANTSRMIQMVEKAAASGADLVVFPEMTDTGYDMQVILKTASTWNEGPVPCLRDAASRYKVRIMAGVSERVGADVFNAVVTIDTSGEIVGSYRKTHLITAEPMLEHHFLKAGDKLGLVEVAGRKLGVITCYEIRFPEIARSLALLGAELIVIPAAWPLVRLPHWQALLVARAIENQVFVAGVGRIGDDTGVPFAGTSMIIGPYGNVIASGTQIHEAIVSAELNFDDISLVRSQIKVYKDRRSDLYSM